jgi:hypothetical protein
VLLNAALYSCSISTLVYEKIVLLCYLYDICYILNSENIYIGPKYNITDCNDKRNPIVQDNLCFIQFKEKFF